MQSEMDDSGESSREEVRMKPLRRRLEETRKDTGLPWETIERDYVLSWMLAGMSANERLRSVLVFKGGTALKKCYFGEYRFSEDLDFTAKEGAPRQDELEKEIGASCESAAELARNYSPLELQMCRYREKEPHPGITSYTVCTFRKALKKGPLSSKIRKISRVPYLKRRDKWPRTRIRQKWIRCKQH